MLAPRLYVKIGNYALHELDAMNEAIATHRLSHIIKPRDQRPTLSRGCVDSGKGSGNGNMSREADPVREYLSPILKGVVMR